MGIRKFSQEFWIGSISRDSIVYYLPTLIDNIKQSVVNNKEANIIKKANALLNPS